VRPRPSVPRVRLRASVPRVRLRASAVVATVLALGCAAGARAATPGMTFYVDGASLGGQCSDAYTPAQAQSPATPWCTISRAVSAVPEGAAIEVAPAVYRETVTLTARDDGVTLTANGAGQPIIDGGGVRSVGIDLVDGVNHVTVEGFEVQNVAATGTQRAVGIAGFDTYDDTIANDTIHAVHSDSAYSYGIALGNNSLPGLVHNITVSGNHIYDIGPGGESMGIWLLMASSMTVQDNEVYLVRKEGIRDWYGLDNSFVSNRLYLNWAGLTLESTIGDYVANNVAYDNVWAFDAKHVDDANALSLWSLASPQWNRFWHNTAYANTHADFGLAMNSPDADYIDIEDNVLADPGDVHLHDFPAVRGPNVIVDGDAYSGAAPVYYTDWSVPHPSTLQTLGELQSTLGWERDGQMFSPSFINPLDGDLGFDPSGMAPGVALPDAFGAQVGAAGVPPATMSYLRYPARVIASSAEREPYLDPQAASDGRDDTYWWSAESTQPTGSVTFDLGAAEPIDLFVLDIFAQFDARNPRGVQIQVSSDGSSFTTVLATTNPDSEGSSYKYLLPAPVTARYVRLNLLSSFGGSSIIFSDFAIGLLAPVGSPVTSLALGRMAEALRSAAARRSRGSGGRRSRGSGGRRSRGSGGRRSRGPGGRRSRGKASRRARLHGAACARTTARRRASARRLSRVRCRRGARAPARHGRASRPRAARRAARRRNAR